MYTFKVKVVKEIFGIVDAANEEEAIDMIRNDDYDVLDEEELSVDLNSICELKENENVD